MEPLYPTPAPVPLLTPDEEIKTFKLPAGLRVEVVAAEPMVEHPVAMTFDADGRIWVAEMRSYMPDVEATGELAADGRISVLEDTNGDGRMDKSTVFLDQLVLPRAVAIVQGGVLVGEPPNLYFCRDTNGDGKCDEKIIISTDYGNRTNPEHQPNGLMIGLDNWIHNADYNKRFKFDRGRWIREIVSAPGQYGITQDDIGRHFFNTNSNYLRGNLFAPQYQTRNPNYHAVGVNFRVADDQECWPAATTAINRGYRPTQLRENGRLRTFTGACSPVIYRGDLLPSEYYGNAFVCEVTANLIRRVVLTEDEAIVKGKNAYEQDEFLTSTYERFRPVNLYTGPDGALYVVDMHHGLIQHKRYVTPYVRAQYHARELDKHLRTGRIFRIVPDNKKPTPMPRLSAAKTADLIGYLAHPNGIIRDTAQRLLVERNPSTATTPLKDVLSKSENPLARMHALWTLEGMYRLDLPTLKLALQDKDWRVRTQAIRIAEPILGTRDRDQLLDNVLKLEADTQPNVRLQFVLTTSAVGIPRTDDVIARVLKQDSHNLFVRDAALSGMRARELEILQRILADTEWATEKPGRPELLSSLALCVMNEAKPPRVAALLELTRTRTQWQRVSLLDGMTAIASKKFARKPLMLPAAPSESILEPSITTTTPGASPKLLKATLKGLAWPGKPGYVPPAPPRPLTPDEQLRFDAGAKVYAQVCTQCHKPDGQGQEGLAPPLVDSEWTLGDPHRLSRIVLHGMRGPITVNGKTWNLDMPGWAALSDDQIAAALTYTRRSWDHDADPVTPATVAKVRSENKTRLEAWTERELLHMR